MNTKVAKKSISKLLFPGKKQRTADTE